jgi:hypothetical protein
MGEDRGEGGDGQVPRINRLYLLLSYFSFTPSPRPNQPFLFLSLFLLLPLSPPHPTISYPPSIDYPLLPGDSFLISVSTPLFPSCYSFFAGYSFLLPNDFPLMSSYTSFLHSSWILLSSECHSCPVIQYLLPSDSTLKGLWHEICWSLFSWICPYSCTKFDFPGIICGKSKNLPWLTAYFQLFSVQI